VETRLNEARTLLATRDAEINDLAGATSRQQQALEEARSINAQQVAEIERLTTSLTVRGGRNQASLADAAFSGEVALRAEIEALRGKSREQAALIAKLQQQAAQQIVQQPGLAAAVASGQLGNGTAASGANLVAMLPPDEVRAGLERDLRALKGKSEDQAAEIKALAAELTALRSAEAANTPDSKVALRARLTGLQTLADQQTEQVRKLRAELAASNERLALQGANFMEQMRRLGAGSLPAAGAAPRRIEAVPPARVSLAERVANARGPTLPAESTTEDGDVSATPPAQSAAKTDVKASGRLADRISSLGKA
jgi:hypothetical protein